MKSGTIPFPRQFGPGGSGIDCKAVKRALAVALGGPHGMSLKTGSFSKPAQLALVKFKGQHDLATDPIYTVQAHAALRPSFDSYGASLMAKKAIQVVAAAQRAAYVSAWRWLIAHASQCHYAEVRPIPENLPPYTSNEIVTDCSGMVEIAAAWEHLPDPSQLGFDGAGNTGTLLHACKWIPSTQAQPADLIVYRDSAEDLYGHHVVAILKVLPGRDFEVGSNGREGDPRSTTHSAELAAQAHNGHGVATCLRWLPAE